MEINIDTKNAQNVGIDYTGCIPGKPSRNAETKKWDQVILPPTAVKNGELTSARVAIVTSTGAATPATVTAFVRQTTNGNFIFEVKRDALPESVKAARKAASEADKAAWKNGTKSRGERQAVNVNVPGTGPIPATATKSGKPSAGPVTVTQAAVITEDQTAMIASLKAAGFNLAEIMAELTKATPVAAPVAPVAPVGPNRPIKVSHDPSIVIVPGTVKGNLTRK